MTPLSAHIIQCIDSKSGVALVALRNLNPKTTGQYLFARRCHAYCLHWMCGWTLEDIAAFLGLRSHSTVSAYLKDAPEDPATMMIAQSVVAHLRSDRPDLYLQINTCDKIAELWGCEA